MISMFSIRRTLALFSLADTCSIPFFLDIGVHSLAFGFTLNSTVVTNPVRLLHMTAVTILCARHLFS